MKHLLFYLILLPLCLKTAYSQIPDLALLDAQQLDNQKIKYKNGDPEVINTVNDIIKSANTFLNVKPQSVTDKDFTPSSGSKNDYMSMGPYWWPDPSKPNGLPYIRKDGERNPEIKKITDRAFLGNLSTRCMFLSLAYFFTQDEKYAAKATQLLSVWFLDKNTRMNPNLNYGQAIPGLNDGRGIGIIESRLLTDIIDGIALIESSASLTKTKLIELKNWYKEYLHWMQTSKNGLDEKEAKNNHGTYYDMQLASFALFTDNKTLAKQILTETKKRISEQIQPNGEQPMELARTQAYSYSTMNLEGWFNIAFIGDKAGVDFWNYQTADGRSIRKALDWLIPYALDEKTKTYQQITPYGTNGIYRLLVIASKKYNDPFYINKADLLKKDNDSDLTDLLYK